jgi:hypothetical protein
MTPDELKAAVLAELKNTEVLKKQIVSDLVGTSQDTTFWHHPAVLILVSFLCTGIVGSALTYWWDSSEWDRQQMRLKEDRLLERRYQLMDDVAKAVSETNTAGEDIIALFKWERSRQELAREERERRQFWVTTSRNWRITSKILQSQLDVRFGMDASRAFENVVVLRRGYGNRITTLLSDPASIQSRLRRQPVLTEVDDILKEINKTRDAMNDLVRAMARELSDAI